MCSIRSTIASQTLLLNKEAVKQISEQQREIFIFEWLIYVDQVLMDATQNDIKEYQKELVKQLTDQVRTSPGPPIKKLLANCLSTLFSVGDKFLMFDTVNTLNDILKNKDDSSSFLQTKL